MKAILTKCLPPTNTKPARIKAYDLGQNHVVISTHDSEIESLDDEGKHRAAASALASKMNWWMRGYSFEPDYKLHGGATKEGYAWVFV